MRCIRYLWRRLACGWQGHPHGVWILTYRGKTDLRCRGCGGHLPWDEAKGYSQAMRHGDKTLSIGTSRRAARLAVSHTHHTALPAGPMI